MIVEIWQKMWGLQRSLPKQYASVSGGLIKRELWPAEVEQHLKNAVKQESRVTVNRANVCVLQM